MDSSSVDTGSRGVTSPKPRILIRRLTLRHPVGRASGTSRDAAKIPSQAANNAFNIPGQNISLLVYNYFPNIYLIRLRRKALCISSTAWGQQSKDNLCSRMQKPITGSKELA